MAGEDVAWAGTRDREFTERCLIFLPDVARYARSLMRDEANADDLVQDTFMLAYQHWAQFVPGTECRAWLFTICRRRFLRMRQRDDRQMATDDAALESLAAARIHERARDDGLDHVFERAEMRGAVDEAIARLPEAFRDVAVLVDVNDQSYEAAAEILQVPIGTVRSRLFRARRLLQEDLLVYAQDAGYGATRARESAS